MLAKQPRSGLYSPEHEQFRETVRRYFKDSIEPRVKEWEESGGVTRELFTEAAKYGILAAGIPEEYGGGGGDFLHHAIVHEEHGYTPVGAQIGGGLGIDGSTYLFLYAGTEEQKKEWLPRYASGEVIAEVCFTEPHSGSDLGDVRSHARRDGSDYIINAHKMWITNGAICTHLPVFVKIEQSDGSFGQGILMVDADAPGVTVSKPIQTLHRSAGVESEVWMSDVRVPAERLLGGKERGALRDAVRVLIDQRLAESARYLAAAELGFDMTVEYVKNRRAFGQSIFDFQNTQFKLAEMLTQLKVLRPFVDECLKKTLDGSLTNVESSMAKLATSEAEFKILDDCLQLHGGMGFAHEMPISQMWTFSRIHRVLLGTSEIHRVGIARSLR
jgi:acyl-CoA dehydrogenase